MAPGPGCYVDGAAVLLPAHRRQHRAHAIQDPVEVDIAQLRFGTLMPALLTSRSMRPWLATICSAALLTSSLLLTSRAIASALPPFLTMFAATRSSSCLRRPD